MPQPSHKSHDPQPGRPGSAPNEAALAELLARLEGHADHMRDSWHGVEQARLEMVINRLRALKDGPEVAQLDECAAELESILLAEEAQSSALREKVESLIHQCKAGDGKA